MTPTLLVRLTHNRSCVGCGATGYCCDRTMLCLYCLGLKLAVECRKCKLGSTLAMRFALRPDVNRAAMLAMTKRGRHA